VPRSGEFVQRFLVGREYDDVFPWRFSPWVTSEGDEREVGSIATPNGRRSDGRMHTYWSVTGEVWEPDAALICEAVNAVVRRGWRARLARRLLGLGATS
jgi:hypothetical protein